MSDFDKEAERERLREKYGQESEEREATQRMSDLLLKGARMTNSHCGTCGDPLFEQNGTTFCPSCHGGPEGVEGRLDEPQEEEPETPESRPADTEHDPVDREASIRQPPQTERTPRSETERPRTPEQDSVPSGDGAERDLRLALNRFAAAAADTDDPRYAKECLAAAREAAETLAALRGS